MLITGIASLVHLLLCMLFVYVFNWGFEGVAWATSIHFFVRFVVSWLCIKCNKQFRSSEHISLFSRNSMTNLNDQFSLGVMSTLMGVWGWWAFDAFTLVATYMSTEVVSAQTILRTMGQMTFMIPVGFSIANGILIGNYIGEGSVAKIKVCFEASMILSLILGIVQVITCLIFMNEFISFFTDHELVAEQIRLTWAVLMIFVVFDTTQGIAQGGIRASGQQK